MMRTVVAVWPSERSETLLACPFDTRAAVAAAHLLLRQKTLKALGVGLLCHLAQKLVPVTWTGLLDLDV
jgi:hypothetical protein